MAKKYKKLPVEIEAEQLTWANWNTICEFADVGKEFNIGGIRTTDGEYFWGDEANQHVSDDAALALRILTLEGAMIANEGDWIIRGVKGELYPCRKDIFEETYEEV